MGFGGNYPGYASKVEKAEESNCNIGKALEEDDPQSKNVLRGKKCMPWSKVPARFVLGIVSFFGFFTNYMLRVNINIAIVAMVNGSVNGIVNEAANETVDGSETVNETANSNEEFGDVFPWDSVEQGMVLGAFYWSYVVILVPGAMLTRVVGAKIVFGGANGLTALLALLTPLAARTGFYFLILTRILQGLASGVTWPAMNTMASHWIPPHERSKFISTYIGSAVGSAVAYPLCGLLIDKYGWPVAFYFTGCITLVWCVFWWLLIFDSPSTHPRISRKEQVYIETAVSTSLTKEKLAIPWRKIFQSAPVWALVVANLGSLWGWMTILVYGPTYLNNIHGFSMKANGVFSGLPNIMRFIISVIFSAITDHLIRRNIVSVTVVRKMATCVVELLPGLLFLLVTNVGSNAAAEVAILTIAAGLSGATSSGPLANSMDLAPNFAGMILGLISMVSMSTGFIIPSIVGAITNNNNTRPGWRLVFIIGSAVSIVCCLVFSIFGSGDVQDWNWPSSDSNGMTRTEREERGDASDDDDDTDEHTAALGLNPKDSNNDKLTPNINLGNGECNVIEGVQNHK